MAWPRGRCLGDGARVRSCLCDNASQTGLPGCMHGGIGLCPTDCPRHYAARRAAGPCMERRRGLAWRGADLAWRSGAPLRVPPRASAGAVPPRPPPCAAAARPAAPPPRPCAERRRLPACIRGGAGAPKGSSPCRGAHGRRGMPPWRERAPALCCRRALRRGGESAAGGPCGWRALRRGEESAAGRGEWSWARRGAGRPTRPGAGGRVRGGLGVCAQRRVASGW